MSQPGHPSPVRGEVIPLNPPHARWRLRPVSAERRAAFHAGLELGVRLTANPRTIVQELEPVDPAEDHGTGRRVLIVMAIAAAAWLILRVAA